MDVPLGTVMNFDGAFWILIDVEPEASLGKKWTLRRATDEESMTAEVMES